MSRAAFIPAGSWPRRNGAGAGRIMSRRPAAITQADIARAIRAAKQTGAAELEVRIGEQSSIVIRLNSSTGAEKPLEPSGEIVL
jgi:hypothetical protein